MAPGKPALTKTGPIGRVKRFVRWHYVITALIALPFLVAAVGYGMLLYYQYQQNQELRRENARFERAEKEVPKASQAIIASLGQPAKVVDDKSCFLPSVKTREKPKSCSVSSDLYYVVRDEVEATALQAKAKGVVDEVWSRDGALYSELDYFKVLDVANLNPALPYNSINYAYNPTGSTTKCWLTPLLYSKAVLPGKDYALNQDFSYGLEIGISCSEDSMTLRYPEK